MAGLPQGWEPRDTALNTMEHRLLSSSLVRLTRVRLARHELPSQDDFAAARRQPLSRGERMLLGK
jgi:hypothetical protein